MRAAFGDALRIGVDANGGWGSAAEALRVIRKIEDCDLAYVEQPVRGIVEMERLAPKLDVPLMADETTWTARDVMEVSRRGAADLARAVVALCGQPARPTFVYDDDDPLWQKIEKIARKVYRASEVTADSKVRARIRKLQDDGYGHYPVCVAKTQYSFSTDPKLRGAPQGHVLNIREVRLAAGAGFIVMICGDIMTMPGLPKVPSANGIDLVDGKVVGLF